ADLRQPLGGASEVREVEAVPVMRLRVRWAERDGAAELAVGRLQIELTREVDVAERRVRLGNRLVELHRPLRRGEPPLAGLRARRPAELRQGDVAVRHAA